MIVESTSAALTVLQKQQEGPWMATALTAGDTLCLPEVGLEIPVSEFYIGMSFPEPLSDAMPQ